MNKLKYPNIYKNKCLNPLIINYDLSKSKSIVTNFNPQYLEQHNILVNCNYCENCLKLKQIKLSNLVYSQTLKPNFKHYYLWTITFNDMNQTYNLPYDYINELEQSNKDKSRLSKYTMLDKVKLNNIIRNLKKKINNYYKHKVDFSFLASGEYGSQTNRAHYHILLILEQPLPNLKLDKVIKNKSQYIKHFKCDLLKSKQYDLYDLIKVVNAKQVSYYVSKYMSKSINDNLYNDPKMFFNYNQSKQDDQKLYYKLSHCFKEYIPIPKQRPFIKKSRKLGIHDTIELNIRYNTLNSYYLNKFQQQFVFQDLEPHIQTNPLILSYLKLLNLNNTFHFVNEQQFNLFFYWRYNKSPHLYYYLFYWLNKLTSTRKPFKIKLYEHEKWLFKHPNFKYFEHVKNKWYEFKDLYKDYFNKSKVNKLVKYIIYKYDYDRIINRYRNRTTKDIQEQYRYSISKDMF